MGKTKQKKIGIYSPYLDIMGGGERYLLSIAELLSNDNRVDLITDLDIVVKAKTLLNINLNKVNLISKKIILKKNFWKKLIALKNYDVFFYMTDGSIFLPLSKKNYLIIQSPDHLPRKSVVNMMKLQTWQVICYSTFMANIIKEKIAKNAIVLPPCIDDRMFSRGNQKKNIILTVGRFFSHLHDKKQKIMIDLFKKLSPIINNWEFRIIGGLTDIKGDNLIRVLKEISQSYPVKILINLPFDKLVKNYHQAKIYWHAAGFAEDEKKNPERMEHFGITTIEAMAAGCVPLVFKGGGQLDIIENEKNGYFWQNEKELLDKTVKIIEDEKLFDAISSKARQRAKIFSRQYFYDRLKKLL